MEYRSEIDGLRAVAVLPVIFFHAGFSLFSGGFVGVDVFFVISGFLITSIILHEKDAGTFTFASFYERRARRILPALFLVITASSMAAWVWLPPSELKAFAQSAAATSLFLSNVWFYLTSGYFSTSAELKPLLHTWSLAVEEQYYVLFPILFTLLWPLGKRKAAGALAIAGVASLMASVWLTNRSASAAFFLLPTRAWELLVGVGVAIYLYRRPPRKGLVSEVMGALGILALVLCMFSFSERTPFPSGYAMVPAVGAALVIAFATRETVVGKALGSRVLVAVGLVSYSAYLWHQPLFAIARQRALDPLGPLTYALLISITMCAAFLSWKYVEAPFRDRRRFSRTKIFALGAGGSAVLLIAGIAGQLLGGVPQRFDGETRKLFSTTISVYESNVRDCWRRIASHPSVACPVGRSGSPPTVALVGDSHAGALVTGLDGELKSRSLSGLSYTYRSCPPLKFGEPVQMLPGDSDCASIRKSFFDSLSIDVPPVLVVNARWTLLMERSRFDNGEGGREGGTEWEWKTGLPGTYEASLAADISLSVREMLRTGHRVILVYPVPEMGWDVPARLGKLRMKNGKLSPTDASTSYATFLSRNQRAQEALDSIGIHPNLVRVKPAQTLCDRLVPGRCVAHINGEPLYFDDNHLSDAGVRLIMRDISKAI